MERTILLWCMCAAVAVALSACDNWNPLTSGDDSDDSIIPTSVSGSTDLDDIAAQNDNDHEDPDDYVWDSTQVVPIVFDGATITASSGSVTVSGSVATITMPGTYDISGTSTDGQVVVETAEEGTVRLILNGLALANTTTAPINITAADKAVIVLADGTQNSVTDAASYVFPDAETDEPNAAIFSKADLTICGGGALTVTGNYNDGIGSKDGLIINGGTLNVTADDDGIRGKDYLIIREGTVTISAGGDGLKSDDDEDGDRGYILVESGSVNVTSGQDAISAATDVLIAGGQFTLTSGGGSSRSVSSSVSAKGIKGTVCVIVNGGTFSISSADDAIHSNSAVVLHSGTFDISSGDDGVHADSLLEINGGTINITKSYEGLESITVTINDGDIHVVASDDGINGAGGNDGSGAGGWPGMGGMTPGAGNASLAINGGCIYVNASGDGLDVNGSITMTAGTVLVNGPTSNGNGALDYDATFKMTGGFLIAAGSSGMAMAPSSSSSQRSVLAVFTSTKSANTIFRIEDSDGNEVLTFKPVKNYQSVAFCVPALTNGATYTAYTGGSSTGTESDGLFTGGEYSGGTRLGTFTISRIVTSLRI